MNLNPIIAHLRDNCDPPFALVGGAATFERAAASLTAFPAAFVLPTADSGQPNEFGNQIVEQTVLVDFTVILAVRNLSSDEAAVDDLEIVRGSVRDVLLGWLPPSAALDCEFNKGEFLAIENGVLWWHDVYRTAHMIRSA